MKRSIRNWFPWQLVTHLIRRRRPPTNLATLADPAGVGLLAEVDDQYAQVLETIRQCTEYVRTHPHNQGELARMEGYRFVAAVVRAGFNTCLMQDPAFPRFRQEPDETTKIGLDNPDNKYLVATIRPDLRYRLWGNRGSSADLVLQLYNAMQAKGGAALDLDSLVTDDDGNFEVTISPSRPAASGPPHEHNWIAMDDAMDTLLVRFSHQDWERELPGEIHIDRVGGEGQAAPPLRAAEMQQRLQTLSAYVHHNVTYWVDFIVKLTRWLPANTLTPLRKTQSEGLGLQISSLGHFELGDDEALLVQTHPTEARYQGFQLGNFWNHSLEYGSRQSSLTTAQCHRSDDGSYHLVVSKQDPGVPNWLDTQSYGRGMMFLRYQGLSEPPPRSAHPTAQRVELAELGDHLPTATPRVDGAARRTQIHKRRRHLQRRYGY